MKKCISLLIALVMFCVMFSSVFAYDAKSAAAYALKWSLDGGIKHNPAYPDYNSSSQGGDCTNFVSQCLNAGGISMNKKPSASPGITGTDLYWYQYRAWYDSPWWEIGVTDGYRWYTSSSWIRVSGKDSFYTYWDNRAKSVNTYGQTTINNLIKTAEIGDVIQFQYSDNELKRHTTIVTKKDSKETCITFHSGNNWNDQVNKTLSYYTDPKYQGLVLWLYKF